MTRLRGAVAALGAALSAVGLGGMVAVGCGHSSDAPSESKADTADAAGRDSSMSVIGDGAATDTSDASPNDAADAADGQPLGLVVATDQARAQCTNWLNCCQSLADGGTYDLQACISSFTTFGWEGNLPRDTSVYSRGHIVVDQAKAAKCVSALNSFPCGMQTPAQWGAVTSACELVIQGTLPSNASGCISSFECAPGNFCDPTVDGGLCTPLAKQGQPCNTKITDPSLTLNPLLDQMCSYLASGNPPLFCDVINNPPDAATCQPLLANGASCTRGNNEYYDDQACQAPALCGDNLLCGGSASYPYAGFCHAYQIQDDGGPG